MSNTLGKDAFLTERKRNIERIEIPELGGHAYLRELYGDEFDQLSRKLQGKKGVVDQRGLAARMLVACLCDEDGRPLFVDADAESLNKRLAARTLLRITKAATAINGMDDDDEAELLGNLETTTPNDSGTA